MSCIQIGSHTVFRVMRKNVFSIAKRILALQSHPNPPYTSGPMAPLYTLIYSFSFRDCTNRFEEVA